MPGSRITWIIGGLAARATTARRSFVGERRSCVYSGNYKATGLYEFAWITNPDLGAAVESFFGLSTKEAYFFGVESFGSADRNGDQILCISWIGANPGQADYLVSVVDNNASSG
jgi:hypothetical protein